MPGPWQTISEKQWGKRTGISKYLPISEISLAGKENKYCNVICQTSDEYVSQTRPAWAYLEWN